MYLEEKYSNDSNRLIPTDPAARSAVFQKIFESQNIETGVMQPLVYSKIIAKKGDQYEKVMAENTQKAKDELAFWNKVCMKPKCTKS